MIAAMVGIAVGWLLCCAFAQAPRPVPMWVPWPLSNLVRAFQAWRVLAFEEAALLDMAKALGLQILAPNATATVA